MSDAPEAATPDEPRGALMAYMSNTELQYLVDTDFAAAQAMCNSLTEMVHVVKAADRLERERRARDEGQIWIAVYWYYHSRRCRPTAWPRRQPASCGTSAVRCSFGGSFGGV